MQSAARITRPVRKGRVTFDDFCAAVPEWEKADLIDGVIYMASPESVESNRLSNWLNWILQALAEEWDLGEVYTSRVGYRLDSFNCPEPDIAFVVKARLQPGNKVFQGPPDLAIEITAESSEERDYGKKRKQYQKFGVREYWIIDEAARKVTLLRLGPKGKYAKARPVRGVYRSSVFKGLWLRPEWLWAPRPKKMDILQLLLDAGERKKGSVS
jgi:Uma2 family endonuclease